jgi:8-oxo-dGTP pyrophosphatase MutT (NUDIX family)
VAKTRRWVIPKGWPMERLSPSNAARREAFEEAGITGSIRRTPIGHYMYDKVQRGGTKVPCKVQVFAMAVKAQWARWPEREERKRQWFSPKEAASRVVEPGLKAILSRLT